MPSTSAHDIDSSIAIPKVIHPQALLANKVVLCGNSVTALELTQHLSQQKIHLSHYQNGKLPYLEHCLLLVDHTTHAALIDQLDKCSQPSNSLRTCLFNIHSPLTTNELLSWPNLCGYYLHHTHNNHISQDIHRLIYGQFALPPILLQQLMLHAQQVAQKSSQHNQHINQQLTKREQQILASLQTGASNFALADRLFLSEHTIKSHLYRIFKKLQVSNRHQAIVWAKNHLNYPIK